LESEVKWIKKKKSYLAEGNLPSVSNWVAKMFMRSKHLFSGIQALYHAILGDTIGYLKINFGMLRQLAYPLDQVNVPE
jgi:hypothetical protein